MGGGAEARGTFVCAEKEKGRRRIHAILLGFSRPTRINQQKRCQALKRIERHGRKQRKAGCRLKSHHNFTAKQGEGRHPDCSKRNRLIPFSEGALRCKIQAGKSSMKAYFAPAGENGGGKKMLAYRAMMEPGPAEKQGRGRSS